VSVFPKPVLGGLLLFFGASRLVKWLYTTWFTIPKTDKHYAISARLRKHPIEITMQAIVSR